MASISISVGPVTSTSNVTNTKASEVFELVIAELGGPVSGTNQEKLDFVNAKVVQYLLSIARQARFVQRVREAEALAVVEVGSIDWSV
jgi:hypothetical protein